MLTDFEKALRKARRMEIKQLREIFAPRMHESGFKGGTGGEQSAFEGLGAS